MLQEWIRAAIEKSGLSQAEVSRRMTVIVGRNIDRAMVSKLSKGGRTLLADEMLAIASISGAELPSHGGQRQDPSSSATAAPGLHEARLLSLFAGALQWRGMKPAAAGNLAQALIEFARTPSDLEEPELDRRRVEVEGTRLARLFDALRHQPGRQE